MTKDYAKRRRAQHSNIMRSHNKPTLFPAWGWMGIGLLLGICCAILYWQFNHPAPTTQALVDIQEDPPKIKHQATRTKTNPKTKDKVASTSSRPSSRFDFYTVLPNMNQENQIPADTTLMASTLDLALQPLSPTEVTPVPTLADDEPVVAQDLPKAAAAPAREAMSYVIQAGSFHRQEQAESLKAQLALLGIEASIQTFKMGNREIRYRVTIGPFASKDHAYLQQQQLEQAQHLHSVVLKIKV